MISRPFPWWKELEYSTAYSSFYSAKDESFITHLSGFREAGTNAQAHETYIFAIYVLYVSLSVFYVAKDTRLEKPYS